MENYNVLLLLNSSWTWSQVHKKSDESWVCTVILVVAVSYLTYRTSSSYLKALVQFFGFANRILFFFFLCVGVDAFLTQYFISTFMYKKKNTFLMPTFFLTNGMDHRLLISYPLCSAVLWVFCSFLVRSKNVRFCFTGKMGKREGVREIENLG